MNKAGTALSRDAGCAGTREKGIPCSPRGPQGPSVARSEQPALVGPVLRIVKLIKLVGIEAPALLVAAGPPALGAGAPGCGSRPRRSHLKFRSKIWEHSCTLLTNTAVNVEADPFLGGLLGEEILEDGDGRDVIRPELCFALP